MAAPKLMGFPLWINTTKRIAKKYLPDSSYLSYWMRHFSHLKVGDFVNSCTGYNIRVKEICPVYFRLSQEAAIYRPINGRYLYDINLIGDKGGSCSLRHCGVEPKLSNEEITHRKEEFLRNYQHDDSWGFAKRYEFSTMTENGECIFDNQGFKAKYSEHV